MTEDRVKQAGDGIWPGLAVNLALTLLKGAAGYMAHSHALVAAAVHSAANASHDIASLFGLRAKKNTDSGHPSGRDKTLSVVLSALLLVAGLELAVSSLHRLASGTFHAPQGYTLIVIMFAFALKEMLFRFQSHSNVKTEVRSALPDEGARRSDRLASFATLIGAGGALLGHYLGNSYLQYLDSATGLFIAALVLKMGYRKLKNAAESDAGGTMFQEGAAEFLETVQRIKGVIAVDELRAKEQGHYVIVDLKISVNPRISIQDGHDIAKMVKQTLMKRFIHVSDVWVRVNPYDPGYPYNKNADAEQETPTLLH